MASTDNWKGFMRKHWGLGVILGVAAVLVTVGSVYVFWWFVGDAQSSSLVPSSLGLWTMSNLITFILHAIFWELLIIGIPVVIAGVVGWRWWMRLPADERGGFRMGKHGRRSGGSGGGGFLLFIAFCIKVYMDGNWNVPIGTFTLNYVVSSMILILILAGVIFGIPATIAAVWWVRREIRSS